MFRIHFYLFATVLCLFSCSDDPFEVDAGVDPGGYQGDIDAFVGQTGNNPGTGNTPGMGNNPGTGNTAGNPLACTPGARIGTCSVYGPDCQPTTPPPNTEQACGQFTCGGGYEKVIENGQEICYSTGAGFAGCTSVGVCQTEQEFCANATRTVQEQIPADPCRRIAGCSGTTPGTIEQNGSLGDACNGFGICEGRSDNLLAQCSVQIPGRCLFDQATDAKFFCEAGASGGREYCEYFVAPDDGSRRKCSDFCASLGFEICDQAQEECCWNNATQINCEKQGTVNCSVNPCDNADGCGDQICRCFAP
ncbi:MAG: hypothetical protein ACPGQS_04600 [Bradymonadia bacterium]